MKNSESSECILTTLHRISLTYIIALEKKIFCYNFKNKFVHEMEFNLIILFTNLSDKQKHLCRKEIRQNRRNSGSLFVMKLNYRNKLHLSIIECQFTSIPQKYSLKWKTKNHARKKGSKETGVFTNFVAFTEKKYKDCTKLFNINVKFSFLFRKIIVKAQFLNQLQWSLQCVTYCKTLVTSVVIQSTFTVLA